jgi:hypothetical protein
MQSEIAQDFHFKVKYSKQPFTGRFEVFGHSKLLIFKFERVLCEEFWTLRQITSRHRWKFWNYLRSGSINIQYSPSPPFSFFKFFFSVTFVYLWLVSQQQFVWSSSSVLSFLGAGFQTYIVYFGALFVGSANIAEVEGGTDCWSLLAFSSTATFARG